MNYQLLLFAMLCVIHICARDMRMEKISRLTKVLLMPSLLWYYLSMQTEPKSLAVLVIVALVLHTIGDAFLLFPGQWLMAGIGGASFFVGHILYIRYLALHMQSPGYMLVVAILAIYPIVLAGKLVKRTPAPIPMFLYMLVLVAEAMFCAGAGDLVSLFGVVFFATSDTLLGYNSIEKKFSDVTIMATYMFAEFLIVVGFLLRQGAL
jgi:hypothetical protein